MYGDMAEGWAGCLVIAAAFFIAVGVAVAWVAPKVWAWIKPFIHALTA